MFSISDWDNKAWYPGVVIDDISLRLVAGGEWDHLLIPVQPLLQVRYFVGESKGGLGVLFFSLADRGGEALGNVENGNGVVLVELHHSFSRGGGDGAR
jgi:hypothetical protein